MLAAGADWVVKVSAQREFFDRLSSPVKRFEMFPGYLPRRLPREGPRTADRQGARRSSCERFASRRQRRRLLDADKRGYTKAEYDRLARPGGPLYCADVASAMKRSAG